MSDCSAACLCCLLWGIGTAGMSSSSAAMLGRHLLWAGCWGITHWDISQNIFCSPFLPTFMLPQQDHQWFSARYYNTSHWRGIGVLALRAWGMSAGRFTAHGCVAFNLPHGWNCEETDRFQSWNFSSVPCLTEVLPATSWSMHTVQGCMSDNIIFLSSEKLMKNINTRNSEIWNNKMLFLFCH